MLFIEKRILLAVVNSEIHEPILTKFLVIFQILLGMATPEGKLRNSD